MVSTSGLSGVLSLPETRTPVRRLDPGVHLVFGPRPRWESFLAGLRESHGRLILVSPDPPPRDEPRSPALRRVWFRGTPARGAMPARASSLARSLPRLAQPSSATAVEGIEVLLFWNTSDEVVEFLRALEARLVRCVSPGLVYVRPRLMDESDHEALAARFPLEVNLLDTDPSKGIDSAEQFPP